MDSIADSPCVRKRGVAGHDEPGLAGVAGDKKPGPFDIPRSAFASRRPAPKGRDMPAQGKASLRATPWVCVPVPW
jgi:hypothetical protein